MSKGLFITGTDTDIGKTYVTALLVKTMRQNGYDTGYYKAAISGAPTVAASILAAWKRVTEAYPYVTMEGSGGIVCPIRHDEKAVYYLEDIISWLHLPVLVIADAGLGTINHVVTTCEYITHRNIPIRGIILNNWKGGVMEEDNVKMIEEITGVPVIAKVAKGDEILHCDPKVLEGLYQEV